MAKKSLKIDINEVSLTLDLKQIFGKPVPNRQLREKIVDEIKGTIIDRTLKGYGVDKGIPTKFVKYSPAYIKFKGQSNVDLELTGSMLNSIIGLDLSSTDKITVGIANQDAPKAHGHTTGQLGKGPLPKRPFLDLTDSEISKIHSKYKDDVNSIQKISAKDAFLNTSKPTFTTSQIQVAIDQLKTKVSK